MAPPATAVQDACSWTLQVVEALELLGDRRAAAVASVHTRLLLQSEIAGVLKLSETAQQSLVADAVGEVADLLREAATDRVRPSE